MAQLGVLSEHCRLFGIDPTAKKFRKYYKPHITVLADFFSQTLISQHFSKNSVKILTSFSMFYDLENPLEFARNVADLLSDDGLWIMEQSYLPTMMEMNSFDTVCHEHLEYYGLRQIEWIARNVGLHLISVELNHVNGGSFSVVLAKNEKILDVDRTAIKRLLDNEKTYVL